MIRHLSVFMFALLGILSSVKLADAQPNRHSSDGPSPSAEGLPPIDAAVPAPLNTATFALG